VTTAGAPLAETKQSARAAGLRWVDDSTPGIRRQGSPGSFRYVDPDGHVIRDAGTLQRISDIAIPPAWTDVWICPSANGHIQATGRDARRRKQYRYHPRFREVRDERKYDRMIAFGEALPSIRSRVDADLRRPGLPRERVLAAVVRLLDVSFMRVGNDEYARENQSFGLTTLRARHVDIHGSRIQFRFKGKSGVRHVVSVEDRRLARILDRCQDLPGEELFEWLDEQGETHPVSSDDVNEYLRDIAGDAFSSKDFRTWAGTVLALCALRDAEPPSTVRANRRQVLEAIKQVSARLGNTPAVCRRCYVHPDVLDAYADGSLLKLRLRVKGTAPGNGLRDEEKAVLRLLRSDRQRTATAKTA
jgi:DNA topoisomerase I